MRQLVQIASTVAVGILFNGYLANVPAIASEGPACGLGASGVIDAADLPEGSNVIACGLVGRALDLGATVVSVPEPGETVRLTTDGVRDQGFAAEVSTAPDGEVRYEMEESAELVGAASGAPPSGPAVNGCDDNYMGATIYRYLTSTWKFFIGDGGLPAGGTVTQLAQAIEAAGKTWSTEDSPCYATDQSRAPDVNYAGTTTTEADITQQGSETVCTARDGTSTIDDGNLDGGTIAANCTWTNSDGTVIESDIRFNTTDHDFTYSPGGSSCSRHYDVYSVLTHEIGHTYGMKDKEAPSSVYQTMYYQSFPCRAFARNLGKSDVRHLRSQYPW